MRRITANFLRLTRDDVSRRRVDTPRKPVVRLTSFASNRPEGTVGGSAAVFSSPFAPISRRSNASSAVTCSRRST